MGRLGGLSKLVPAAAVLGTIGVITLTTVTLVTVSKSAGPAAGDCPPVARPLPASTAPATASPFLTTTPPTTTTTAPPATATPPTTTSTPPRPSTSTSPEPTSTASGGPTTTPTQATVATTAAPSASASPSTAPPTTSAAQPSTSDTPAPPTCVPHARPPASWTTPPPLIPIAVTADCAGLLDHPTFPGQLPDLRAVAAKVIDTARQAGLSVGEPLFYPPHPNATPAGIYLDITDQGGLGALLVQIARYLRPEWSTRPTGDKAFPCLHDNPLRGNTSVNRLPDGSTVTTGTCGADSHGCSPVTVFSTNGIAVQVTGTLFVAGGNRQHPVIRDGEPLTVPTMLHLAQTIATL